MTAIVSQPGSSRRLASIAFVLAAILFAAACISSLRSQPPRVRLGPSRVIGTLVVIGPAAPGSARANEIELADVTTYLVDARGNRVARATTQLDGRFELRAPGPGAYRFCYEIGGSFTCGPTLRAAGSTVWLRSVPVAGRRFVHGRVLTGDRRPCWISDSFFGLDVSTRVSALPAGAGGAPLAATRANTQGEYALFGLNPARYEVTASCEAARATATVGLANGPAALDLDLPNRAPVVRSAAAFAGQRGLVRSDPAATLDLRSDANDPDGDTVEYIWRAPDGGGQLTSAGAAAQWRLTAEEGLRSVYLMARDGRGGFTYRRIDIEGARNNGVSASGRAVDETTGAAVRGATVSLGSASARTGADGWFSIEAPRRDDDRYVLNIRHPDYALSSRILDRSARGDSYQMIPVQAESVRAVSAQVGGAQAGARIELRDRASGSLCGNPAVRNARAIARRAQPRLLGLGAERAFGQNGLPPLAQLARLAPPPACATRGAEVALPATALVDARGERVEGPVRASVATLDPARRTLPGDYSAITRGGATAGLVSFGAVDVSFNDALGRPLNLRQGTTAEVRMSVPEAQLTTAPATVKMWSYDEARGRWIEEGEARLVRTAGGAFYVGETRHFSTINMDIELNPQNATCVRFELDPAFNAWTNLTLRAYVTFGGTSTQAQEVALDSDQYHSIRALPYGPGNTLRLELRGVFNGVNQVLLDDIIVLGPPRPRMTGSALFPPYPYNECGTPELLSPAQGVMPFYGNIDATGRPAFLTGPTGALNPNPGQGAAYYATVDAGNVRTTLGAWWAQNGFDANGGGGANPTFTRAAYMNHNDLGFGRDMHCILPGGNRLACYVTNYGLPDQNPQNANDAAAQNPATRAATVTMEYDPAAPNDTNVQFFVYNGGVSGSTRLEYADLDGLGPKPVPHLCMVCHGGNYVANRVEFARFREFDLPSFHYLGGATWDYGQPVPNLSGLDATAFARLNQMVRNAHPGTPIGSLIDAWYQGNFGPGTLPGLPAPPSGWAGQTNGYHNVYGRTCRTCHIARDAGNPNDFVVFNDSSNFSFTGSYVCGIGVPKRRLMPNAFITYRNFWADSPRVLQFEALTGTSNCGS